MKIVDIDAHFEKFIREYMVKNAGAFTEEEWEDKIPELYDEFGNSPLKALGDKSPIGYYEGEGVKGGDRLCKILAAHIDGDVPVSDYLCDALVKFDTEDGLIEFLKEGTDEELTSYAINILCEKGSLKPLKRYLQIVVDTKADENLQELCGEAVIEFAKHIKEELIEQATVAKTGKQFIYEALAGLERDDRIFEVLIKGFAEAKDVCAFAHLLVKYGDERALDALKAKISQPHIKYSVYAELKYAIEALGGEYEDGRDFSQDKTYKKIKNLKS